MSVKYSPNIPIVFDDGQGVAAPIKYGATGKLHGLLLSKKLDTEDLIYVTKNGVIVAEFSCRQGDSKNFLLVNEAIAANDVFKVFGVSPISSAVSVISGSLLADIAPSNYFKDYGLQGSTDLSFGGAVNTGTGFSSLTVAQMSDADRNNNLKLDGRKILATNNASAVGNAFVRENTGGRTGTNFYGKFLISPLTVQTAGNIIRVGVAFQVHPSNNEGYIALVEYPSDTAGQAYFKIMDFGSGLISNTHATLTGSGDMVSWDPKQPVLVEFIKDSNRFILIGNRSQIITATHSSPLTTAGGFGIYAYKDGGVGINAEAGLNIMGLMVA